MVKKKTGTPSSFVIDGVRIDMRRLSSHSEPTPKKPAASATKPAKAKERKPKKRPAKKPSPTPAE